MTDLFFRHNGQKYVMQTNTATGDRVLAIVAAPGLYRELTREASTSELWDAASDAYGRERCLCGQWFG